MKVDPIFCTTFTPFFLLLVLMLVWSVQLAFKKREPDPISPIEQKILKFQNWAYFILYSFVGIQIALWWLRISTDQLWWEWLSFIIANTTLGYIGASTFIYRVGYWGRGSWTPQKGDGARLAGFITLVVLGILNITVWPNVLTAIASGLFRVLK